MKVQSIISALVVAWFGPSWSRQNQTVTTPERPRTCVSRGPDRMPSGAPVEVGRIQQRIAEREPRAVLDGNLHQPARDVDGVARRRDVLVAFAEARGDDRAEMRADLEAELIR